MEDRNEIEEDDDESEDESQSEPLISIENQITEELIKGMEQQSFVAETHTTHIYKIQELLLKQRQKN